MGHASGFTGRIPVQPAAQRCSCAAMAAAGSAAGGGGAEAASGGMAAVNGFADGKRNGGWRGGAQLFADTGCPMNAGFRQLACKHGTLMQNNSRYHPMPFIMLKHCLQYEW